MNVYYQVMHDSFHDVALRRKLQDLNTVFSEGGQERRKENVATDHKKGKLPGIPG